MQVILREEKSRDCRPEPMEKESSKKIIQNQGRKLCNMGISMWNAALNIGECYKKRNGENGNYRRRLRVGTEYKEL